MICTEVIRKLNFERSKSSKLKESKLIKEVEKVKVERVQINKRGRKGQNHILVFSQIPVTVKNPLIVSAFVFPFPFPFVSSSSKYWKSL